MANVVRRTEDLLAVHMLVRMTDRGLRLLAQPYRGEDRIAEEIDMNMSHLGYVDHAQTGRRQGLLFEGNDPLPSRLKELFYQTAAHLEDDEAIWLQIGYGAEVLAAYPWEERLAEVVDRAILRVPNFARNTYRRNADEDPIGICAGSPRAKGAPSWMGHLLELLATLETDRPVVLYLDNNEGSYLRENPEELHKRFPERKVHIAADPPRPEAPARRTFISQSDEVSNPWLRWILDDLRSKGAGRAHAVHFLCSGYSQGTDGALALPESPGFDRDAGWARFVGVAEFATFADQLDCQITGFTALGAPIWQQGVRLFCNELTWKRPGAVIMDHGYGQPAPAYRALLSTGHFDPQKAPGLTFSVHPKAVSETDRQVPITRTFNSHGSDEFTFELGRLQQLSLTEETRQLPDALSRRMDRMSSSKPKSALQSARDRGAIRAMDFLSSLAPDGEMSQ